MNLQFLIFLLDFYFNFCIHIYILFYYWFLLFYYLLVCDFKVTWGYRGLKKTSKNGSLSLFRFFASLNLFSHFRYERFFYSNYYVDVFFLTIVTVV